MESVHDIKEALSARSRTATLDELANEGRKKVRLIRAEHVAAMIHEAVHAAIEQSGLLAPAEVEKLVEKSRQEFRSILREREQEQQRAQANEQALANREQEVGELRRQWASAQASLAATRSEQATVVAECQRLREAIGAADAATASATARIEELTAELAAARASVLNATCERDRSANESAAQHQEFTRLQSELGTASTELAKVRDELARAQADCVQATHAASHSDATAAAAKAEVERLQAELAQVRDALAHAEASARIAPAPAAEPVAAAPASGASSELLLSLVQEMATLKANLLHAQSQAQPQPQPKAEVPDLAAALEKLTGSLNDRLELLGKKMGVSAAVGGETQVDFGGLFKDSGKSLESNMDAIEVKQKAGGGIAGNLARLKKLKGGS